MRDNHHHIIVIAIHTAHALQDNVVGIDDRHVKAEKFVHRVMSDGGRRAEAKKAIFLAWVSRSTARFTADMSREWWT
jgi:hypothetical protein